MESEMINYILLVSSKNGNYNGSDVEEIKKLKEMFGQFNTCPMMCNPSFLMKGKITEKTYVVKRDENQPLQPSDIKELTSFFSGKNKNITIYETIEIYNSGNNDTI